LRLSFPRQLCLVASAFLIVPLLSGPAGAIDVGVAPGPLLSDGFARDLLKQEPDETYGAFLHFRPGTPQHIESSFVTSAGLQAATSFDRIDVVFAVGPMARFAKLIDDPQLTYIEHNGRVVTTGDTGPWATRARVAQSAVAGGPYRDSVGNVLDGSGVGVAIVDTGVDATHPDLSARTAKNFKIVCSTPGVVSTATETCFGPYQVVEDPYADATGGHGTHVAGIVAGDGSASNGTFTGVAPGASLFGFGVGEADRIFSYTEAFQYISDNLEELTPRIRVINNSWGDASGSAFDANSVVNKLADDLTARGVSVIWAAGNGGGDGNSDRTSSYSKNPTPGVISVANYDDLGAGSREGTVSNTSSRGQNGAAASYPDVSAPGSSIVSTCRPVMPVCHLGGNPTSAWAPNYSSLSGTSMAAPHVSGVAAMLYQAAPALTPAELEDLLQDHAHKFGSGYRSDPQNPGETSSFDKGAGLVDVPATLDALSVAKDGDTPAGPHTAFVDPVADAAGPGADDIVSLAVEEEEDGLRYKLEVADVTDVGPMTSYYVAQKIDGRSYRTSIRLTSEGLEAGAPNATTNNLLATQLEIEEDAIIFFLPFEAMGDPQPGSPVFGLWASSYESLAVDTAPGGLGIERDALPEYGTPFSIRTGVPDPDISPTPTPTATPTATPSPSPTPVERGTSISFDPGQLATGEYGDTAILRARLVDESGAPVVNQGVVFELRGLDGIRSVSGLTDGDGWTQVELALDVPPDPYALSVKYPGQSGVFGTSEARTSFEVSKETTVATLAVTGKGSKRVLDMSLLDDDPTASPIANAFVLFYADGKQIGTGVTESDGTVLFEVPSAYRGGKHLFEVTFEGDRYLESSTASAQS
jgi:subtilisin family serine protease